MAKTIRRYLWLFFLVAAFSAAALARPAGAYEVESRIFTKNQEECDIHITYPVIVGLENHKLQAQINGAVEARFLSPNVTECAAEHVHMVHIQFETALKRPQLLSIQFSAEYFLGGAHPIHEQKGLTINMQNGTVYQLADLFQGRYQPGLNELVQNALSQSQWADNSFESIAPNQGFFLTESALVVLFDEYEIAPYAAGLPRAVIPYKELPRLLKPAEPLSLAID